ncbi:tetratricopeptide repeat protein [Mycobacterium intracellulare]|uniref:tetratricopeptide repeat protein n=1 Tax=Mycobacterium intracellulare TaxID=1767 RepID=UPI001CD9640C|nr:tetratricopeptide repeat protein [Mycobacterium intracellulare]MCA2249985.1 tetratricopeptide repeat protein [Mycobacterium intracellulare]
MSDERESLLDCADRQIRAGDASQALDAYNEVLEFSPDDVHALEGKAAALTLAGRFNEALECHNALVASGTDLQSRLRFRSKIFAFLGRYDDAIKDLDTALAVGTPSAELLKDKGMCLHRARRLDEAAAAYRRALEITEDEPSTLAALGDVLLEQGSVSAAVETFESASQTGKAFSELDWVTRGNRLLAAGRAQDAIRMFLAANSTRSNREAWRGIAQAYRDLRQYADAVEAARHSCELAPMDPSIWHIHALALSELGRRDEALESFRKAIALEPTFETAWSDMAVVLSDLGRFEEAIEAARSAIEITPDSAKLWSKLGLYLYHSGDHQGALSSWKHSLTLDPRLAWAASNASTVLCELGQLPEALELVDRALEIDDTEAAFWANKADVLERLGREADAIKLLDEASRVVSSPTDLVRRKVRLLCDTLGRNEEALDVLAEAVRRWPSDSTLAGELAELMLINGRYDAANNLAAELLLRSDTSPIIECAMRFVILTSHALANGLDEIDWYLEDFTRYYSGALRQEGKARFMFGYQALRSLLLKDTVSATARMLLLTLIDLQEQRIDLSELSFFEV